MKHVQLYINLHQVRHIYSKRQRLTIVQLYAVHSSIKDPNPVLDSVPQSEQLLQKTSGADQWNQRIHDFTGPLHRFSPSDWSDRWTQSESGSGPSGYTDTKNKDWTWKILTQIINYTLSIW